MPELPEVENVKQSLLALGMSGQTIERIELLRKDLRVPFPRGMDRRLSGQSIVTIDRRAKYLLFETQDYYLVSHLGMTGSWRTTREANRGKHDHVVLYFSSGLQLVFNDPRRFGLLDLVAKESLSESRWLKHLGIEPLAEEFRPAYLFARTRKMKGAIKGFLMDQRRVVGVGNIYASEALFAAGVRPSRPAGRITQVESEKLVHNIQRILLAAIAAGGSTIRDYRNSKGESGKFQARFLVYDKEGQPCAVCGVAIRAQVIAGRNTFWCPKCQR